MRGMKMKDKRILPQRRPYRDRFGEFLDGFKEYEKERLIKKAQDDFLDAYSLWLKTKELKNKLEAIRKGMKLEALDSKFSLQQLFPLR